MMKRIGRMPCKTNAITFSRNLLSLATLFALLVATGCQTAPRHMVDSRNDPSLMAKAVLPRYVPGEYFVYDDGTSTLVTEVAEGQVSWKHHNGAVSRGYPNFLIPELSWTSVHRSSQGRTKAAPDLLWPPVPGERGAFAFDQVIAHRDGRPPEHVSRRWTCEVEGTTRVTVPAGRFDTIVFACNRHASDSGAWRATERYYYAPQVGHYVLRENRHRSRPDTRRALVAYGFNSTLLPREDQLKLNKLLQTALTRNEDGQASLWRNRSGDIAAMVVPIRRFTSAQGKMCREYYSIYSVSGRLRQHAREVCRQPDGLWQRVD
jgi:hypothetical protein